MDVASISKQRPSREAIDQLYVLEQGVQAGRERPANRRFRDGWAPDAPARPALSKELQVTPRGRRLAAQRITITCTSNSLAQVSQT